MFDKKGIFAIWSIGMLIGLAIPIPHANAQAVATPHQTVVSPLPPPVSTPSIQPVPPAVNPFPLASTVSYDSLRIMAYSGQSEQAIKLAQDYLKTHENSTIRVLLARMLAWDKQFDAAREQLMFVLTKHPGDYDASDCLSDVEMWIGNYNRAIDVLTNALKYDPKNEGLLEKREIIRAKSQVAQGHRDQAIQIAEEYLKSHDSLNMRVYLATQFSALNQNDKAIGLLEYVLGKDPTNTNASNELANIEITVGNYSKATEVVNNGLQYSPKNDDLLRNKSLLTEKLTTSGKPPAANSVQPAASTPVQQPSGITYAELKKMSENGQRQKAILLAQESLKQKDNTDIRILLGLMLSWNGRYDEARLQLQPVLKKSPDSIDAAQALANVEIWSKNNKQALAIIDKALKYHPGNKDLLKMRSTALGISNTLSYDQLRKMYASGQSEKAKEIAREYLKKNDNIDIRLLLGLMESWDEQYDDAKIQFVTVLKKSPGYTDASLGLANVDRYTNNNVSALKVINAALKYHPANTDLLKKRADIIQSVNQTNFVAPGLFSLFNTPGVIGPSTPGKKLNAISFDQEVSYVDDLKEIWKVSTLGYARSTPYGPIDFSFVQYDRFNTPGNQVVIEAYPHLYPGAYMYLGYGYSTASFIARNYIGFEPFFSLPHGFECSVGERILQFRGGITHLYTGSFSKYWGNYWIALRPYYTGTGSRSYYLSIRRYFSTPDSYINLTVGGGEGPNTFEILNPNSISPDMSRGIRLNGDVPLTENLIFTWLVAYSSSRFPHTNAPSTNVQQETDVDAGFIWRF